MNLIPFQFENVGIRVVIDADGETLFVGKDVCLALGYARPSDAMQQHCKGAAKHRPLQTPGGMQELRVLSEPDVFRLAIKSELPGAEKFERWVFEEVLPSIRKTGAYAASPTVQPTAPPLPSTQAKTMIADMLEVAALFKVPEHIAQTEAVKSARLTYNVDFSPLLLSAPAQNEIRPEDEMLEPTELGKRLGMGAVRMNKALCDLGLQEKVNGAWQPTDAASGLCSRHQWIKGGKSGYNYKWKVAAVEARLNMLEAA